MDISVVERLLETYFRRPLLYLVPLLLCVVIGGYSALTAPKIYSSGGVLSAASDTLLSNLSDVDLATSFGPTPASVAADRINEQMRSDEFVLAVAEQAGLGSAIEAGVVHPDWVRARVRASPQGMNLLSVRANTTDPVLSQRLATSTIDSFTQSVIDEDLSESAVAENFYEEVAQLYDGRVKEAKQALDDYLLEHPEPSVGARPAAEQTQVDRLSDAVDRVEVQYLDALSKAEDARLITEQARVDIAQRLRVIDPPQLPSAPMSGMRAAAMTVATFLVLGLMLSAGTVVVAAFLDKSIQSPADVRANLGFNIVAPVPTVNLAKGPRA